MEWDGASLGIGMEDEESGKLTLNLGVIEGQACGGELTLSVKLNYRH